MYYSKRHRIIGGTNFLFLNFQRGLLVVRFRMKLEYYVKVNILYKTITHKYYGISNLHISCLHTRLYV